MEGTRGRERVSGSGNGMEEDGFSDGIRLFYGYVGVGMGIWFLGRMDDTKLRVLLFLLSWNTPSKLNEYLS